MGAVVATFGVVNPLNPTRQTRAELLVETGALYRVLPGGVLRGIGIEPLPRKAFKTADGRRIERALGEAVFEYNGERATSNVVFGAKGDPAVLGRTALGAPGLEVDSTTGTLWPATLPVYLVPGSAFVGARLQPWCKGAAFDGL